MWVQISALSLKLKGSCCPLCDESHTFELLTLLILLLNKRFCLCYWVWIHCCVEAVVFCLYLVMLPKTTVWNSLCLILTQVTVRSFVFKCTSVSSTKTTETCKRRKINGWKPKMGNRGDSADSVFILTLIVIEEKQSWLLLRYCDWPAVDWEGSTYTFCTHCMCTYCHAVLTSVVVPLILAGALRLWGFQMLDLLWHERCYD